MRGSHGTRSNRTNPHKYGVIRPIHHQAAQRHGARSDACARSLRLKKARGNIRASQTERRNLPCRHARAASHATQQPLQKPASRNERPVGGTTGRVKPYGRLGWMGARAEYSRWGGDYRSHIDKSQDPRRTFKTPGDFFNLVFGDDCRKKPLRSRRYFAAFAADLSARHRRRGVIQRPAHGSVIGGRRSSAGVFSPQACLKPRQVEPPAPRPLR